MKNLTHWGLLAILLVPSFSMTEIRIRSANDTRALPPLCATCPTGAATFCNLCVPGTGVIGSLTIQNSLTLCPGVTAPCGCIFNDGLSFNTDETHYNIKDFLAAPTGPTGVSVQYFQPYFNGLVGFRDTISGWPMTPAGETDITPIAITAEFQVPWDLDPTVTPVITLHWFYGNQSDLSCPVGNYVNWQVTADFFTNLTTFPLGIGTPKYIKTTGDILLSFPPSGSLTQQQVDVPLTGPALVPGAYAQITATRTLPTGAGHVESDCLMFLTLIEFKYRKLAQ